MLELQAAVGIVVSLLVRGDYAAIEAMTRGRRLSGTELDHAVRSYGRRLRTTPTGGATTGLVLDALATAPEPTTGTSSTPIAAGQTALSRDRGTEVPP